MIIFQLAISFITALALLYFIRNRWILLICSIIASLFITLQITSVSLIGVLIDYKFIEHSNLGDIWSLRKFYLVQIITGLVTYFIVFTLLFWGSYQLRKLKISKYIFLVFILIGALILSLPSGSMFRELAHVYNIKQSEVKSFDLALRELGIDPTTYVKANDIIAKPGNNIIVISLESLEKGFLKSPLEHLTPNLNNLAEEYTFYNMSQCEGSGWTEASIYTSLTGLPALFRSPKNETFNSTAVSEVGNLGTVLQKAGYDMTYFIANKEFSGLDKLLSGFSFEVLSEKDLSYESDGIWGLKDKDLFTEATKTILEKSTSEKPFAVFMNTISGHFPDGVYDKSLEGVLPAQRSELEFMNSAVDHFIGEMIAKLEEQGILENTDIYIYPDHLFMGELQQKIPGFTNERSLYLITTAEEKRFSKKPKLALSQLDIPRLIIEGSKIETNATFLTDYVKETNINSFIYNNINNIISINEPLEDNFNFSNEINLEYSKWNKTMTISQETGFEKVIQGVQDGLLYRIYFDDNMNYLKCVDVNSENAFKREDNLGITWSHQGSKIFSYLFKEETLGVAKQGINTIKYDKNDITIFDNWAVGRPILEAKSHLINLYSVSYSAYSNRGPSEIITGLQKHQIRRGLNLLLLEENTFLVEHYDTYESKKEIEKFIKRVQALKSNNKNFAVVGDDSIGFDISKYDTEFENLGFYKLKDLKSRVAYLAYVNSDGVIVEQSNKNSRFEIIPIELFTRQNRVDLRKDSTRYIAHAGGAINNQLYTNSLEALNYNYNKGFKMFEIDLLKTSDGVYVGAHDWQSWKAKTGYEGVTPPSHEDFMKLKILQKYTPIDMTTINKWFTEHNDAVLVTDKVNEPKEIASQFIDNSRLMMEIFSIEALKEGQRINNLKGLLFTNDLLYQFKGEEIERLKKLNVKYLAVSRKFVAENKSLFVQLKREGIKTYVFNINNEPGIDEKYVYDYEIGLVHGMYADRWTFTLEEDEDKVFK